MHPLRFQYIILSNVWGAVHTGAGVFDAYGGAEYEYEIRAEDGTVIQFDRESGGDESRRAERRDISRSQDSSSFIGEAKAIETAQIHAGVQADNSPKSELDKDDGISNT